MGLLYFLLFFVIINSIEQTLGQCPQIKKCTYKEPQTGFDIIYEICQSNDDPCPADKPTEEVTICKIFNYKKSNAYSQCAKCKRMGGPCKSNSDCCQAYYSAPKPALTIPVILHEHCDTTKGICTACLKTSYPCLGEKRLPCCESSNGIACRTAVINRFLPSPYDICSPNLCKDEALEKAGTWRPICYIGHVETAPQYVGVNMCKCPKDGTVTSHGYKCTADDSCVKCGLEGTACKAGAKSCCYAHSCVKGHCKQFKCRIEGQSCRNDGCKKDINVECKKPDKKCCGNGELICLRKYKTCSSEKCLKEGEVCTESFRCCPGMDCFPDDEAKVKISYCRVTQEISND